MYDINSKEFKGHRSVGANCGSPANIAPGSLPVRKNPRLIGFDYSTPSAYFITVCTHQKRHLFGQIADGQMLLNNYGTIVATEWLRTGIIRQNITLDAYVVMPNHFHALLIFQMPEDEREKGIERELGTINVAGEPQFAPTFKTALGRIVACFKQAVTLKLNAKGFTDHVWQRGYYDHIIRNDQDYGTAVAYIHSILQTGEGMNIIMIELPIRYTLFLTQCGILHDVYHTTSCEESTSVKDY